MNTEIKEYLKNPKDTKTGIDLFRKYGNNPHFLRLCETNPTGNKKMLLYQLSKLIHTKTKISKKQAPEKKVAVIVGDERPAKSATFEYKFRDQFPFLNDKNCPDELKILAADKITAWRKYTALHEKLFDCTSEKECYEISKIIIENYKENRLIFDELNFYQKHKQILGKHPVFDRYKRYKEYANMSIIDLVRLHDKTIPNRIWRINDEIKKKDKPHLLEKRESSLREYEADLAEIKKILKSK